ncbi:MAG: alpha/beta fold hydrolase, partial [Vicinamibacterales bacterium]
MLSARSFKYEVHGKGEPVLFIHGALIADTFLPLIAEPTLGRYKKITYRRRGYDGSPRLTGPFTIEEQAEDALELLRELDIECAHLVGHSGGGVIALQVALAAPRVVRSLVLLEPALLMVPSASAFFEAATPAMDRYKAGDAAGAAGAFITLVAGPDWRTEVAKMIPGGVEQAEKDAAAAFEVDIPSVGAWRFDRELASQITQPTLYVVGTKSGTFFDEGKELCRTWIPQTEEFSVKGARHHLHHQDP